MEGPSRLFSDKVGKACVWQHCSLGTGHWWPTVPLGKQGPFMAHPEPKSGEMPLKKTTALEGSSRVGGLVLQASCSALQRPSMASLPRSP